MVEEAQGGKVMKRMHTVLLGVFLTIATLTSFTTAQSLSATRNASPTAPRVKLPSPIVLPMSEGSLKIAVIGDTGSGKQGQYEVGRMMNTYEIAFPFTAVIMVGDNIYGADKAEDMKKKFEEVYQPLTNKGVKFYAALGNHDSSNQRFYNLFNMKGEEYYKIDDKGVSLYALNSNYMDKRQLDWLTSKLASDTNKWKIAFFHHPPFSSGKFHGSAQEDARGSAPDIRKIRRGRSVHGT